MAVYKIHDPIGQIGREVGAIIRAAIFPQAAGDVDSRKALAQRELHVWIGLVVTQKNVKSRLLLLDEVVLESQCLFVVCDNDVVDIDGLADQRAGFGICDPSFMKIRGDPAAQVLGLTDIDDFAFRVLIQIHASGGGDGPDFGLQVHAVRCSSILLELHNATCDWALLNAYACATAGSI